MSPALVTLCCLLLTNTAALVWGSMRLSYFAGQLVTKLDEVDRRSLATQAELAGIKIQPSTGLNRG